MPFILAANDYTLLGDATEPSDLMRPFLAAQTLDDVEIPYFIGPRRGPLISLNFDYKTMVYQVLGGRIVAHGTTTQQPFPLNDTGFEITTWLRTQAHLTSAVEG